MQLLTHDFTIDKWLDNKGDCDDLNLLRSDNNEFAHNCRTFAKNETHLMEQLEDDLIHTMSLIL